MNNKIITILLFWWCFLAVLTVVNSKSIPLMKREILEQPSDDVIVHVIADDSSVSDSSPNGEIITRLVENDDSSSSSVELDSDEFAEIPIETETIVRRIRDVTKKGGEIIEKIVKKRELKDGLEKITVDKWSNDNDGASLNGDDLAVAESHIFVPVFRYKSRIVEKRKVARSVK